MTTLIIVGCGGHGAVVAEAAVESANWSDISFLDDNLTESGLPGISVVGRSTALSDFLGSDVEVVVAIGDNRRRIELMKLAEEKGAVMATVIHPAAVVSASAKIGSGTVVCAGAIVSTRAVVGAGCIVNHGSTIDHDCDIGDGVHVSPGANLAGNVRVDSQAWIGIGATVRDGTHIGSDAVVGAGAAVVSDVEDNTTVGGVPARELISTGDQA